MWSGLSQWGRQGASFVTTAIFARILVPEDFGLLGMATVFTGFLMMVSEFGTASAIIQKQDLSNEEVSSIFWLNVMAGLGTALLLVVISPLIASFYSSPKLVLILDVLGFGFIASSLGAVQQAKLTKALQFATIARVEFASVIFGGIVGLVLAALGYGVWSLVAQSIATLCLATLLLWIYSPWRPLLRLRSADLRRVFNFSVNLLGFNIVNFIARNADSLLIGRFLGAEALGYYSLAYRIMLFPLQNVSSVVNRVLFPVFSAIQNDTVRIRERFLQLSRYVGFISFPLMFGLFVLTDELVSVVFGERWMTVSSLLRIFAFVGMAQSLGTNVGVLYLSKGRTDAMFRWGIFSSVIVVGAIGLGLQWGISGVATLYAAATLLLLYPNFAVPLKFIEATFLDLIKAVAPVFLISVAASIVLFGIRLMLRDMLRFPDGAILGIGLLVFVSGYFVLAKWRLTELADELLSITRLARGKNGG